MKKTALFDPKATSPTSSFNSVYRMGSQMRGFPGSSVVKNLPAKQETQEMQVRFLGQEDPLVKEMATHPSNPAWEIPWTEKPDHSRSHSHTQLSNWTTDQPRFFSSMRCERRESRIIKKTEHWRNDAFKLWCWRRLLRVPWTARRSNQSILKEISPEYSLEGLLLKLKLQYFGHLLGRVGSSEKTLMLGKIEAKGERRSRGWDGQTASPTQWRCIQANFRR